MTGRDHGDRATLSATIARLQDETDRAELSSNLGGQFYGRYMAKLGALIAARTRLKEMDEAR